MIQEVRGDALYVIDGPDKDNSTTMAEEYADDLSGTDIDTSFACTFAPYIQQYDTTSATYVYVSPTGEAVKDMAITDKTVGPWFAPAGTTRGLVNAQKAKRKIKESEADTLYAARINPIRTFTDVGITIFGQKTLQIKDSELDRINVRRMLLYLRKSFAQISITLLFDQNDDVVVRDFITKAENVLSTVKKQRGLSDYRIKYSDDNTPESLDQNQLFFELYLKPIGALEFIGITFVVTPTGVSFQNI